MSRLIIGSRAELIGALRRGARKAAADGTSAPVLALMLEPARALAEELFLDALFIVAQFPGGQVAEAAKCCYAYDVRQAAGLCRATWTEEAFWCGLVRVRSGRWRRTRLHAAARGDDAARVDWLLARGDVDVDAGNTNDTTALHFAVSNNRCEVVRSLLDAGADIDAVVGDAALHNKRYTPLHIAASIRQPSMLMMLLLRGAGMFEEALDGSTAAHIAAVRGAARPPLARAARPLTRRPPPQPPGRPRKSPRRRRPRRRSASSTPSRCSFTPARTFTPRTPPAARPLRSRPRRRARRSRCSACGGRGGAGGS
jgi:hypothetical protein